MRSKGSPGSFGLGAGEATPLGPTSRPGEIRNSGGWGCYSKRTLALPGHTPERGPLRKAWLRWGSSHCEVPGQGIPEQGEPSESLTPKGIPTHRERTSQEQSCTTELSVMTGMFCACDTECPKWGQNNKEWKFSFLCSLVKFKSHMASS